MAFSASAFGRSSRPPTMGGISDWRSGVSKALRMPSDNDMRMIRVGPIRPNQVSAASTQAWMNSNTCTCISSRRRSWRSIQAPASGPTTSIGASAAKAASPSSAADPVSRYTSQASATC